MLAELSPVIELDRKLLLALNFDGGTLTDTIMWWLSDRAIWIPLYLVMGWLLWRKFGWRQMLLAVGVIVVAVVLSDQICNFFKHFTPKFRPSHTDAISDMVHTVNGYRGGLYGTVSAHAATLTAIAVASSSLLRRLWWSIITGVWVAAVCYSRMYLGLHYPADILLGIMLGALLGYLAVITFRAIVKRKPETFNPHK